MGIRARTSNTVWGDAFNAGSISRRLWTGGPAKALRSGFDSSSPASLLAGTATLSGTPGDDTLTGTSGNDTFDISQGGNDTVFSNGGYDTVLAGATLNSGDHIVGLGWTWAGQGSGYLNGVTVVLDGDYSAGLTMSPTTLVNVTNLQLNPGHSYSLTMDNAVTCYTPSGPSTLWVDASTLHSADNLYYDGRAIVDGKQQVSFYGGDCTLYGGGGDDTIQIYGRNGTIYGGDGNDLLVLAQSGTGVAYAGAGLNSIEVEGKAGSNDTVYGGPQDDDISVHSTGGTAQTVVANGDAGDDYFTFSGDGSVTANGGDGADVFYLEQGIGATVTLGSGIDILVVTPGRSPFATTPDKQTTYVTDFAAGAGGDIVYLYYALRQAQPTWGTGTDPFAAGYLQIIQSGADAVIQIKTNNAWHSLVVLENTTASAVLPGVNIRYGMTPTETVEATADYTIGAGQVVTTYGSVDRDQFNDTVIPAAVYVGYPDNPTIKPVVRNYGTIVLSSIDLSLRYGRPVGGGAAVAGGPWGATFENYGTIKTYTRGAPLASFASAYGLSSLYSWTVVNAAAGRIELSTAGGAWGISCAGGRVTNNGLIDIHGGAAYGIYSKNGYFYSVVNTGTISVSSLGGDAHAIDASEPQSYLSELNNSGTIRAASAGALNPPVGVYIRTSQSQIDNSGMINAAHAIEVVGIAHDSDGPHSVIVNNTGRIIGEVLLGVGDDHYNGANGSLSGMIDGGAGNDVIICGADWDMIDGDDGNDTLWGGGGDDTLTGGAGNDALDGGDGFDKAVFSGNFNAYTVVTNADGSTTVAGPDGTDTLRNIEEADFKDKHIAIQSTFSGTPGDDTLTGTESDDVFDLSQGGNDTVSGLSGSDTFNMGATLTALDSIDGGDWYDTVSLSGDYATTPLVLGPATITNVEQIVLASGHSYNLAINEATVANFHTIKIDGSSLAASDVLTFDGRANRDGYVIVVGGSGNDVFRGAIAVNQFNGGAGVDTVVYGLMPGNYYLAKDGDGNMAVYGPDNHIDTLKNIEQASFDATGQTLSLAQFQAQSLNGLNYIASYGDLIRAFGPNAGSGGLHYIKYGYHEGRTVSFDPLAYIASYSDLIAAFGTDAKAGAIHYIKYGYDGGRTVSFDPLNYIASYGDLIAAFGTDATAGALHYIQYGRTEGRSISFNPLAYIASYNDLMAAFGADAKAGTSHFIQYGYKEGRTTSFNPLNYIASYGDLIDAFGADANAGATHYIQYGHTEGRTASFNPLNYIASYGDLITAFGMDATAGVKHYIQHGYHEGRSVSFDPVSYLLTYQDLGAAGYTAQSVVQHYIDFGHKEGRSAAGAFGTEQTQHALTLNHALGDTLGTPGDEDWFAVTLTAGQSYDLALSGADSGGGTLADPFLGLYDAHGQFLTSDNDSGPGKDSLIHFTATSTGTYYLVASGTGTGTYQLAATG